jgi:iron(II)-dependent oxidoreductase
MSDLTVAREPLRAISRKSEIRDRLDAVRQRTLWLLDQVPDDFLRVRVHEFYSPIGWHFGHVGRTEEYWVVGEALGQPLLDDALTFILADTPDNPKDNRVNIPDRAGLIEYLERTRASVLRALARADLDSDQPILADGYAWEFAIQHECQHQETIAEMLHLIQREQPQEAIEPLPWKPSVCSEMVAIPGGAFTMGSDDPFGYDNEKPAHLETVADFQLSKTPVTAFEWSEFIADGGYSRPDLWSAEGWVWRTAENATKPEFWESEPLSPLGERGRGEGREPHKSVPSGWLTYGPWGLRPLHPDEPVCGISAHEADAFAKWAGKRLPTEAEWEYVAATGLYSWGDEELTTQHANHGLSAWRPLPPAKILPANGLHDLAGNVWEWTSSAFLPYEGFEAYPYDGYSKDHMLGAHRVCRGGSWATSPGILRRTFRNWYVPTYRQGFLGMRLAADK